LKFFVLLYFGVYLVLGACDLVLAPQVLGAWNLVLDLLLFRISFFEFRIFSFSSYLH